MSHLLLSLMKDLLMKPGLLFSNFGCCISLFRLFRDHRKPSLCLLASRWGFHICHYLPSHKHHRFNKMEPAVFKLWMLYFQRISFLAG